VLFCGLVARGSGWAGDVAGGSDLGSDLGRFGGGRSEGVSSGLWVCA